MVTGLLMGRVEMDCMGRRIEKMTMVIGFANVLMSIATYLKLIYNVCFDSLLCTYMYGNMPGRTCVKMYKATIISGKV
jgi:hypothetical protein